MMEDVRSRMVSSDNDSDLGDDQEQQSLPVGFRTREPLRKGKRLHLIKEVAEEYVSGKDISNEQEVSADSGRDGHC